MRPALLSAATNILTRHHPPAPPRYDPARSSMGGKHRVVIIGGGKLRKQGKRRGLGAREQGLGRAIGGLGAQELLGDSLPPHPFGIINADPTSMYVTPKAN